MGKFDLLDAWESAAPAPAPAPAVPVARPAVSAPVEDVNSDAPLPEDPEAQSIDELQGKPVAADAAPAPSRFAALDAYDDSPAPVAAAPAPMAPASAPASAPAPAGFLQERAARAAALDAGLGAIRAVPGLAGPALSRGANEGVSRFMTYPNLALDSITGGLFRRGRDALGGLIDPKGIAAARGLEDSQEAASPFLANTARATGYVSPVGVPAMASKATAAGLQQLTAAAPKGLAAMLTARPVAGAATGAAVGGTTSAAEESAAGGSPAQIFEAGKRGAKYGAAFGAGAGTVAAGAGKLGRHGRAAVAKDVIRDLRDNVGGRTAKSVARDEADITSLILDDPELAKAIRKPASKALPVIEAKKTAELERKAPAYATVDQAGAVEARGAAEQARGKLTAEAQGVEAEAAKLEAEAARIDRQIAKTEAKGTPTNRELASRQSAKQAAREVQATETRSQANALRSRAKEIAKRAEVEGTAPELPGGVKPADVLAEFDSAIEAARKAGQEDDIAAALDRTRKSLATAWEGKSVVPTMELRAQASKAQKAEAGTSDFARAREIRGRVTDVLEGHLSRHLQRAAETGGDDVARAVGEIEEFNRRWSALRNIEDHLKVRAEREGGRGRLTPLMQGVGSGAAFAATLATTGSPTKALGAAVLPIAGPAVLRAAGNLNAAANRWLARLSIAAESGVAPAELRALGAQAIEAGVPAEIVRGFQRRREAVVAP